MRRIHYWCAGCATPLGAELPNFGFEFHPRRGVFQRVVHLEFQCIVTCDSTHVINMKLLDLFLLMLEFSFQCFKKGKSASFVNNNKTERIHVNFRLIISMSLKPVHILVDCRLFIVC